jgi:uncharacterized RDD family membrane protein YckC
METTRTHQLFTVPTITPNEPITYASFGQRLGAWCIDTLLLGILILMLPAVITRYDLISTSSPLMLLVIMGEGILVLVAPWFYFAWMEASSRQASLGKMMVGLRVTDLNGDRLSIGASSVRFLAKFLSYATLSIGFLMSLWSAKKQTLHDSVAGTLVIQTVGGR